MKVIRCKNCGVSIEIECFSCGEKDKLILLEKNEEVE